jgi:hypothetical protein
MVNAAGRIQLESYSRLKAIQYFTGENWTLREETVGSVPYDLVFEREGHTLYVEVKATTGPGDSVLVTDGEVRHARDEDTALFVVTDCELVVDMNGEVSVKGGRRRLLSSWAPATKDLHPTTYRYFMPAEATALD